MGGLDRRLRALEAGRTKDGRALSAEALRFLSDEELEGLLETLEADIETGEAWFEDLYAASSERSRRALDAYYEAIEAAKRGEELPSWGTASRSPPDGTEDVLELMRRAEAGDEEARREVAGRSGYEIWKHYKK